MMFWCVRDAFPNHLGAENQAGAGVHPGRISPSLPHLHSHELGMWGWGTPGVDFGEGAWKN